MCVQNRACLFGEVRESVVDVNAAGQAIQARWEDLPSRFAPVQIDAMILMPNHLHGILVFDVVPPSAPVDGAPASLGRVLQWFKTMTTNDYIHGVKRHAWHPFDGRLWQRNYYEHIIRDDRDLDRIRAYIAEKPSRWALDAENPERKPIPS